MRRSLTQAIVALLVIPSPAWAIPTLYLRTFGNPVPGDAVEVRISGLTPGETVSIVGGLAAAPGATCPPALAFCLDVAGARVVATAIADGVGSAAVPVVLPATLRPGATVALQAVQASDGQISTAVTYTISAPIAISGSWDDLSGTYGQLEVGNTAIIDDVHLTSISDFDNAAQQAFVTWLRPNGWYYWQRLDWTVSGGTTWMCWSMPYPAERTARMLGPSDRSDPSLGGCYGGPWLALSPAEPEIAGAWQDDAGRTVTLDAAAWRWGQATGTVSRFSNRDRVVIGQNQPGGPAGGRWSRLDWTVDAAGDAWLCHTRRDASSEWAARQTPAADPADLGAGCRGAAWSQLMP